MRSFRRAGAFAVAIAALGLSMPASLPASAQTGSTAPAASAEAYGLDIEVTLPLGVTVDEGPFAHASQDFPPQAAAVDTDQFLSTGQIPSGGAVVDEIAVLSAMAGATNGPSNMPVASASALATDVRLLSQGGTPLITAQTLRAVSTSSCTADPTAEGTLFENVVVGPVTVPDGTPDPNTNLAPEIFGPLGLRVILNEQHKAADGRGLVVNAIHIFHTTDALVPTLLTGDVIVSHAMSTVNCPNGAPSTGNDNPIFIVKDADKATARRGDTVTYTAVVQNKSSEACAVNQFIDHLPVAFEFVSTAGALGTVAETVNRPGGGTDMVIKPEAVSIAPGGSIVQTIVLKVKDDAAPATYFNNVELLCANLGNWVKGLDAPVQVITDKPHVDPPRPPQCSDKADNDGDGKIDFPNDPGCASPQDDDERDTMPRTGLPTVIGVAAALLGVGAVLLRRVLNSRP